MFVLLRLGFIKPWHPSFPFPQYVVMHHVQGYCMDINTRVVDLHMPASTGVESQDTHLRLCLVTSLP